MKNALARGLALLDKATDGQRSERAVCLKRGADIKPEAIRWLWPGWLCSSKLTILAGDAGAGKTTLALDLASTVTQGVKWPDGTNFTSSGNILIWSAEDGVSDTLIPRLTASGADMNRCYFIDGMTQYGQSMPFDPAQHMAELNGEVERIGGVSLLIIDPIVSAVSGDMHRANDVRRSLQPVVDFAAAQGCAVIGISHFSKGGVGKSPQERVIGSQAFGALARMVLVVAKEEGSDQRVLARAKCNIAPDDGGFTYCLEPVTIGEGINTSRIVWGGAVKGTAKEILREAENDCQADDSKQTAAQRFLEQLLDDGTMPVAKIKEQAKAAGHSWATIRRAQTSLGIEAHKHGMAGGWLWTLPCNESRRCSTHAEDVQPYEMSTFSENEHLREEAGCDNGRLSRKKP